MSTVGEPSIMVFSTSWCPDCRRAKWLLDQRGVAYRAIDIEEEPEAEQRMLAINGGQWCVPTIVFPDGSYLMEPSNPELHAHLAKLGLA